jgi:integrase
MHSGGGLVTVYRKKNQFAYMMQFEQNGIRVHKSTGKYTEEEALRVQKRTREHIRRKIEKNLPDPPVITLEPPTNGPVQMTLGEACMRCYKERWRNTKGPEFAHNRAMYMARIIGESWLLQDIEERHIRYLVAVLSANGKSAGTINRYMASLKTILNMAHREWRALDRMPAFRMMREPAGRIRIFSQEEEATILNLLSVSKRPRAMDVADLICVLLDTGMRLGEALAIETRDVDFENKLITIWINKTDKPRSIPMTDRAYKILQARAKEGPRLFPIPQASVHKVWDWIRRNMAMKNDKQFVLHTLRHTFASRMVQAGVDLYSVKELLGHSTIRVTERYAHLSPARLRAAIDTMERRPGVHSHPLPLFLNNPQTPEEGCSTLPIGATRETPPANPSASPPLSICTQAKGGSTA